MFDARAPHYEAILSGIVDGVADSRERAVLYSLSYNTSDLIGLGLQTALTAGDRAEAYFEIRYRSNGTNGTDLTARRYTESQIFGLFDNPNPTTKADIAASEALLAFGMWTKHELKIASYETTHAVTMASANAELGRIGDHYGHVAPIETTLSLAKDRLFSDYADVNNLENGLDEAHLTLSGYNGSLLRTTLDKVWVAPETSAGGDEVAAHTVDRTEKATAGDLIFGSYHTDGTDTGAADTLAAGRETTSSSAAEVVTP